MIEEIKTWLISCDRCPNVYGTISAHFYPSLPAEWTYAKVHNCGMTGYTRTDVLCPMCTEKQKRS